MAIPGNILPEAYPDLTKPTPWLTRSEAERPVTRKDKIVLSRMLYKRNGLLRHVIQKMAQYPLTKVIIEMEEETTGDKKLTDEAKKARVKEEKKLHELYDEHLKIKEFLEKVGVDKHTYATATIHITLDQEKRLHCPNPKCPSNKRRQSSGKSSKSRPANGMLLSDLNEEKWEYSLDNAVFKGECPKCNKSVTFRVSEHDLKRPENLCLKLYPPDTIKIKEHEFTGERKLWYCPTDKFREDIRKGDKWLIKTSPLDILKCVAQGKDLLLDQSNVFHLQLHDPSQANSPWPQPTLLRAFRNIYHITTLRQAAEQIAKQHMVPLPIFFPQIRGDEPMTSASLSMATFKSDLTTQIKAWIKNPNRYVFSNIPVGHQMIGGQGNMLLPTDQIRMNTEEAMLAMGMPQGLLMGNAHWAGNSVAMRIVENQFLVDREQYQRLLDFIVRRAKAFIPGLPKGHSLRLKEFRKMDDTMYRQMMTNAFSLGLISHEFWCNVFDVDYDLIWDQIVAERKRQANLDKELQKQAARAQAEAQQAFDEYTMSKGAEGMAKMMESRRDKLIVQFRKYVDAGIPVDFAIQVLRDHEMTMNNYYTQQSLAAQAERARDAIITREQGNAQLSYNRSQDNRWIYDTMSQAYPGQQANPVGGDRVGYFVSLLNSMPLQQRDGFLQHLKTFDSNTYDAVVSSLGAQGVQVGGIGAPEEINPLPEQKAPTREGGW